MTTTLRSLTLLAALVAAVPATAAEVVPPIDERFAAELAAIAEKPDFRRHVVPLLGRLGCNGRACHGSFQGQGGFMLSLFGYDFKADHANLMGGDEPRTNLADPAKSLILAKPLEEVDHDGGKRFDRGSWQHRVLLEWISQGAEPATDADASFERLEVEPREILATKPGDSWQLKAVAVWSDGTREDVTPLCRFQSNDDQVATIDETGKVTAAGSGDTHVVTFYDNGVVPVPVLFPVSKLAGAAYPAVPTPTRIDELVVGKLRKLGVVPSDLCTDAEFLRRVSLDLTGTLPTAAEVEAFLADARLDKRDRKVDELLASPGYAAWWATKFCDWTGNNLERNQNNGTDNRPVATAAWYEWLRSRIAANVPYDEIVEGIVLARSRLDDESYEAYCERMSDYQQADFAKAFAEQPYLPYFWSRRNFQTPQERALGFAYTFLGVRIQCAECHKHPFDQWTKDDFARFQNFFTRVRHGETPDSKDEVAAMLKGLGIDSALRGNDRDKELVKMLKEGQTVPYRETFIVAPAKPAPVRPAKDKTKDKPRKTEKIVAGRTATVLGGDEHRIDQLADPREVLMDWMRDEENPYFARAIVNRVWAAYFNVGIVEPPDDLSLANPPSNEALLDHLAAEFRRRDFDLKWLHREIVASRTYQTGWRTNETNRLDERNFSRAVPRRIPAEVALDAIRMATAADAAACEMAASSGGRAVAEATAVGWGQSGKYALAVFGRSTRESNCDCDRSLEPSLLQTVFLQNDRDMLAQIERKGGWVETVSRPYEAAKIESDRTAVVKARAAEQGVAQAKRRLEKLKERGVEGKALAQAEAALAAARRGKPIVPPAASSSPAAPSPDDLARIVRQAYLRTLSRPPTEAEASRAASYFGETASVREAARDLLWALLNTKEFLVNH
jgi:hypothetical protein